MNEVNSGSTVSPLWGIHICICVYGAFSLTHKKLLSWNDMEQRKSSSPLRKNTHNPLIREGDRTGGSAPERDNYRKSDSYYFWAGWMLQQLSLALCLCPEVQSVTSALVLHLLQVMIKKWSTQRFNSADEGDARGWEDIKAPCCAEKHVNLTTSQPGLLCLYWQTPPPVWLQTVFWVPYFPLRRACLFSNGKNAHLCVYIITLFRL